MPFRATDANYNALRRLSIRRRLEAASDVSMGQMMVSMLTPTQAAELFPKYYLERNPDIGGFLSAMPTSLSAARQREFENQINNTASGSSAGANYQAGGYRKAWQEEMDRQKQRTTVTRKGAAPPPPQLTIEQRQSFDALKAGDIDINDKRVQWLKNAPEDVRKQAGIGIVKDEKGERFHYTAPQISDEEARKSMIPSGNFESKSASLIPRLQKDLGVTKEQAAGILGSLGAETGGLKAINEIRPVVAGSRGGFGWAQWTGDRRIQFEQFSAARGLNITSDEANYQFLVHELKTTENRALQQLKGASSVEEAARAFTGSASSKTGYLRPGAEHYEKSVTFAQKAYGAQSVDPITQNYTPDQLRIRKEQMATQIEAQRLGSLAAITSGNLPTSPLGGSMGRGDAIDNMMKIVGRHEQDPDQKAMIKKFLQDGGHGLEPDQTAWCAATVGSALRQAGYKDIPAEMGGNVATSYGGWGRQVDTSNENVARGDVVVFMKHRQTGEQLGIGQVGGHVGMATGNTRVNAQGQTEIETIEGNVGNQGDKKWHVMGSRGMQIRRARPGVEYEADAPLTQPVTAAQVKSSEAVRDIKSLESVTQPQGPVNAAGPVNVEQAVVQSQQQKTVQPPAEPAPKPAVAPPAPQTSAEKYKVDTSKFVEAIRNTQEFKDRAGIFGGMVPESTIISGFNDDPRVKSAGVRLDEKGVMHFDKGMTPEAKSTMADFKSENFMTKIESDNKQAPTKVSSRATGGPVEMNTEKIAAYPIGGLRGDNAVVVNAHQKPLFTMNTNEGIVKAPGDNKAQVIPNNKDLNVAPTPKTDMTSGMMEEFNSTITELKKDFANLKPKEMQAKPSDMTIPNMVEPTWLAKMAQSSAESFQSPTARRVAYRAAGMETGEPNTGFHYSHRNNS